MQIIDRKALDTGRITGILPVRGGTGLPVWMLCGASDGPTLVLTAGVHGCEYVGIVTLRQLHLEAGAQSVRLTASCEAGFGEMVVKSKDIQKIYRVKAHLIVD